MYFTRMRVPRDLDHQRVYLEKAIKYLPLIGLLVGALCSLVFLIFCHTVSIPFGILASMVTGLLFTGALHEDGLADVCDGFGGGWTKEKILEIMKDSRIGAFGAMGLMAVLAAKFLLLDLIAWNLHDLILCILAAHALSRLMPVLVIQGSINVTHATQNKSRPLTEGRLKYPELVLASIFALLPFFWLSWQYLMIIPFLLLIAYGLTKYFTRRIGGYTGDCLGAIQQIAEIGVYLGYILISKYYV